MASKLQFTAGAFFKIYADKLAGLGIDAGELDDLPDEERDAWQAVADAALESQGAAVNEAHSVK